MTLRQDCELWATFDSEDVDANRGIVRDRSGQGRTLEASGGPTYGQASPVGEAVGFDGTDDKFVTNNGADLISTNTRSAVLVAKWDGGNSGEGNGVYLLGGIFTFGFRIPPADVWRIEATDSGGNFDTVGWKTVEDEYVRLLAEWDNGTLRLINLSGPTEIGSVDFPNSTLEDDIPERRVVGNDGPTGDAPFSGAVTFVGEWSRLLSSDEKDQLGRMTDRMVSKL